MAGDADEFLVYPQMERAMLPELCSHLDSCGADGLRCLLLDMYSNRPIRDAVYAPGQDPLEVCSFFDPASHYSMHAGGTDWMIGGVRRRVFGTEVCLHKAPLLKFTSHTYPLGGYHDVFNARLAELRGVVLHFKLFSTFQRVRERGSGEG